MSAYNFLKKTNGVQVTKDGVAIHNWPRMAEDFVPNAAISFDIVVNFQAHTFYMAGNTFSVNPAGSDIPQAGQTPSQICDTLRDTIFQSNK